jgi:hypothetical protein
MGLIDFSSIGMPKPAVQGNENPTVMPRSGIIMIVCF